MNTPIKLPFITLVLLISFASVNAVLFTPGLPDIAKYFKITNDTAQLTVTWFLIGYALGQLIYGPVANRYGRKPALYMGISLQIISSLICIYAGIIHLYSLLVVSRFLLALGSGVGLKITFTLLNECYEPKIASQKISYMMLAFAITPGIGIALGGVLTEHFSWMSCFYASALYGVLLLLLVIKLPETLSKPDLNALTLKHLIHSYAEQFKNSQLLAGGCLMGVSTCFVYVFAALAPFIAINIMHLNTSQYGYANILPPLGMIAGSLVTARLATRMPIKKIIPIGIIICGFGALFMLIAGLMQAGIILFLFVPMIIIYFGVCFILANASSLAMSQVNDKSHGAAVMSFSNMGLATMVVLSIGYFSINILLLPIIYIMLCFFMVLFYRSLIRNVI